MNILHHLDHFRLEGGGVTRAVADLSARLAARGHRVTVAVEDDRDVPDAWRGGGDGLPRAVGLGRPTRESADALVRDAHAVHLHGMWTRTNLPFFRAARRRGVPCVFSPHGMLDDWSMGFKRLKKRVFLAAAGRRMLEASAFVHCSAQAELEQSRKWFPRGRGVVIPLILDLAPFRDPPGPEPARGRFDALNRGRPVILFLSRLHPVKGVEALLHASAILRDRGVEAETIIAGSGDEAYAAGLRGLARELRLDDRVTFPGPVFGPEKLSLFQAADVLVLASAHENFGFVTFEALAAGMPVVTTRTVQTWPELLASGGAVVTDGSPAALADEIAAILRDEPRRREMAQAGRRWALEALDPARTIGRYEALYDAAVRGTPWEPGG